MKFAKSFYGIEKAFNCPVASKIEVVGHCKRKRHTGVGITQKEVSRRVGGKKLIGQIKWNEIKVPRWGRSLVDGVNELQESNQKEDCGNRCFNGIFLSLCWGGAT